MRGSRPARRGRHRSPARRRRWGRQPPAPCRGRVSWPGRRLRPAVARRPGGTALRGQGRCAGLGDAGRGWHGASVRSLCPRTRRGLTCRAGQPSMSRVRHHAGRWNGNRAMRAPVLPRRERARRPSRGPVRGRVASAGRRPGHLDNTFVVVRPGLVPPRSRPRREAATRSAAANTTAAVGGRHRPDRPRPHPPGDRPRPSPPVQRPRRRGEAARAGPANRFAHPPRRAHRPAWRGVRPGRRLTPRRTGACGTSGWP